MNAITAERVQQDRAPWTAGDTAIGVILTLGPLLALTLFSNAAAGNATTPKTLTHQQDLTTAIITFILTAVLEGVFLIAPIAYARRRAPGMEGRALGLRSFNPVIALVYIAFSYVVVYFASNVDDALNKRFHFTAPTNVDQLLTELHSAPMTLFATLIAAVVVAPICEEIFFRSFLLQGLRTIMPTWLAVIFSALVFAIAHLSPGSFALLFVLGLLLGTLRVATRSVWPGIALHTLNNALVLVYVITLLKK